MAIRVGRGAFLVLYGVLMVCVVQVRTLPNERQAQELMLLDTLGKRGGMVAAEHSTLIDMLGRSTFQVLKRVRPSSVI